jgi:hypothetical protein
MPSTYHLFERYGLISPAESGQILYAPVKYGLGISVQQGITNQVYSQDATADYSVFSLTGLSGYYDPYFATSGVGSARYTINGTSPNPTIKFPSSDYWQTSADTYKTGQIAIWSEYALQVRLDLQLRNNSDTQVGGTDSSSVVTLTPYEWNTISVTSTANSTKVLMTLNLLNVTADDYGKKFWVDNVQIENNRYITPYYNGVVRSAGQCSYTLPNLGADYTVTGWAVVSPQCTSAAGGSQPFFTLYKTSTSYVTMKYQEGATKVNVFKDDTDPDTDLNINAVDYAPGDKVFFALVHNAGVLKAFIAKNGDASLSSANANTDWENWDTVYLGSDPVNSLFSNSPIEQFLIFDEALSDADVLSIFNSSTARTFGSDLRTIFAAATPDTVGTSRAVSTFGVGSYRYLSRTTSLDVIALNGSNGGISSTIGYPSASHLFYGDGVKKLAQNLIISAGTDLATNAGYRILGITYSPTVGSVAYAMKI